MESGSLDEYRLHFESDVFVSYAHTDDDRIGREQKGWVEQFHEDLSNHISVYLGADARVWRDSEIRNNDDFEKKITRRLGRTALFLPLVSASFLSSEWCMREVKEFTAWAEKVFGIHVDGEKKRIFKVERIPVDRNALPDELQGTTTYRFFVDGKRVLRPNISDLDGAVYYAQIVDLAVDVVETMHRLAALAKSRLEPNGAVEATAPQRTVYLAETTYALEEAAAEVRRDLKDRGYRVLPEIDLPRRAHDYREKVAQMLARCAVCVHLVGADYGFVPEGESRKSNVWIQHELALARSETGKLEQIVWLTATEAAEERQKAFIEYLRTDPVATARAETLEGGLEELKTEIHDRFERIEKARSAAPALVAPPLGAEIVETEPPRVYILCERADRQTAEFIALRKYLTSQGVETMLPTVGESEGETLDVHREKLAECDGALIYYGAGAPRWFEVKLNDFRKLLRNRKPPVGAKAVYIAQPTTLEKEEVETNEAVVLRPAEGFAPETLAPFLAGLNPRP